MALAGGGGEGGFDLVGGGGEVGQAVALAAGGVGGELGGGAGEPVTAAVGGDLGGGLVAGQELAGDDGRVADPPAAGFVGPVLIEVEAKDQAGEGGGGDGAGGRAMGHGR